MTETPERLWLATLHEDRAVCIWHKPMAVEYVRADRIEELEAKLAKAVEVAEKSIGWLRLYGADVHREAATLAELKGKKDD